MEDWTVKAARDGAGHIEVTLENHTSAGLATFRIHTDGRTQPTVIDYVAAGRTATCTISDPLKTATEVRAVQLGEPGEIEGTIRTAQI